MLMFDGETLISYHKYAPVIFFCKFLKIGAAFTGSRSTINNNSENGFHVQGLEISIDQSNACAIVRHYHLKQKEWV